MNKIKWLQIIASVTILLGNLLIFPISAYSQTTNVPEETRGVISGLKPSGGTGGQPFKEPIPTDAVKVFAVRVWGGQYVDAVQFLWKNAQDEIIEGKKWGGDKGVSCIQLEVNPGQYIKSLSGTYGDHLDKIVIERSDGYTVSCGGEGGQNKFGYTAADGEAIWSFFGRSGDFIDAIGVIFDDLPKQPR